MSEMLLPLLDDTNSDNIERFNDFSKIFFKDYDKKNKGYINKKDLKEPLKEILNHFSKNSLSYYKLKLLFSVLDNKKNKKIKELIDVLNTKDINKTATDIIKIFSQEEKNKINFDNFKEIVKILLYCLIDKTKTNKNNNLLLEFDNSEYFDIVLLPDIEDIDDIDDEDFEIISLNSDDELSIEKFVCDIIEEILNEFDENIDVVELREIMLEELEEIIIDNTPIKITSDDIDNFYINNNIQPTDNINKNKAEKILFKFISELINKQI